MIEYRRGRERGYADHGWLKSYHSFSFADYYDPQHVEFSDLRVINEDTVAPGQGFGTHSHKDMEIITYVLEGALEHKDSLGNGTIIHAGEVQRMSAGSGIRHSEFNPSLKTPAHFLQIWIQPEVNDIEPGYEQKSIEAEALKNRWCLIASGHDEPKALLRVHQNMHLYASVLQAGSELTWISLAHRKTYIHVIRGEVTINGELLQAGDALKVSGIRELDLKTSSQAECLLFDLRG